MQYRRLRWHSRRRQEALILRLNQELKRWLDAWSVEPSWLSLQPVSFDSYRSAAPQKWLRFVTEKGVLRIGAPALHLNSMGALLAKAKAEDDLMLGKRVGERALKALVSQWVNVAIQDIDIEECEAPSDEIFLPQYGFNVFSLKGSSFSAYVVFDADITDELVPSSSPNLSALSAFESALGFEKVQLNVSLDLGETKLADTIGLQVGDVLVSNTSIQSVFHLTHPDQTRLACVQLSRIGSRRAIQIESPNF